MTEITLGPWLPSQADYQNPGLVECLNVIPGTDGYDPFNSLSDAEATIGATCIGAKRFERSDSTRVIVAGTTSDLYVIVSGTATASSLGLSLAASDRWSFEQFGQYIFASTKGGALYYLTDVDSDTSFSTAPNSPPKANHLARIGDFLFTGDIEDIDASDQPYRIRWSSFNNPTGLWTTDIARQASFVDMPTRYGPVTGLSGGNVGLIFQKYGISRIQFIGGGSVFRKEVIDEERGCVSAPSIARVGPYTYFLGHDGFCRSNGSGVEVVSNNRVWRWFRENANVGRLDGVQAAVDWPNRCVVWGYYGQDRTSVTGLLMYAWEQDRWSRVDLEVDWLVESTLGGTSLEDLDALYATLEDVPVSLDSPEYRARGRQFSAFQSGSLKNFTGTSMQATMETGDFQIQQRKRSYVTEVTPLVENVSLSTQVAIGTRSTPGGTLSYTSDVTEGSLGWCPFNADGRYIRARMKIPAGAFWEKATGLQIKARASGIG